MRVRLFVAVFWAVAAAFAVTTLLQIVGVMSNALADALMLAFINVLRAAQGGGVSSWALGLCFLVVLCEITLVTSAVGASSAQLAYTGVDARDIACVLPLVLQQRLPFAMVSYAWLMDSDPRRCEVKCEPNLYRASLSLANPPSPPDHHRLCRMQQSQAPARPLPRVRSSELLVRAKVGGSGNSCFVCSDIQQPRLNAGLIRR
jgi:hypothetical protein